MIRRLALCVLAISVWAATPSTTVNELIDLVRAGLRAQEADTELAKSLHKLKLAERPSIQVIEELESEGAGKKVIGELETLRQSALKLPATVGPLPFEHPSAPGVEERNQVLDAARQAALNYTKSLPDFICMQSIRRWVNLTGYWKVQDTLDVKLTFFGQREDYKLLNISGRPSIANYRDVGGATTQGEFGSLMRLIFDASSETTFEWSHWTTLRRRRCHVFTFRTRKPQYAMEVQGTRRTSRMGVLVSQRGFVYVDRETNNIFRVIADADRIPREFPVRSSSTALDYELTKVGTREFLLPLRAEIRMGTRDMQTLNEIDFKDYQKFSSEAVITFDPK